ncbi:6952_t:CDS:2, partial [Diversispora eburnea]
MFLMMNNVNDERIILNDGGVKYETYQSTLTAYPETLLGAMFHERNKDMLHPTNGNEYFFDRNGRAFHYIMEFYHTGENLWPGENALEQCFTPVSQKELMKEFDYFQIPLDLICVHDDVLIPDSKVLAHRLDGFITALIENPSTMYSLWPYIERVQKRLKPYET